MKCLTNLRRAAIATLAVLMLSVPSTAFAQAPVKIKKFQGAVDLSAGEPFPFVLKGKASHLGKFKAYGEIEFAPGEEEGTLVGDGVVVFRAANGDLLVGNVNWLVGPVVDGKAVSHIHFSWRDSVEFNGMVVSNTGRFVESRPPGLVVKSLTIIDILIWILRN